MQAPEELAAVTEQQEHVNKNFWLYIVTWNENECTVFSSIFIG